MVQAKKCTSTESKDKKKNRAEPGKRARLKSMIEPTTKQTLNMIQKTWEHWRSIDLINKGVTEN